MVTRVEAGVICLTIMSTIALALLFVYEARKVGYGSCRAAQMEQVAKALRPLLELQLLTANAPNFRSRAAIGAIAVNESDALHNVLHVLEEVNVNEMQIQLFDFEGNVWADSQGAPRIKQQRPLPLHQDIKSITAMVHNGAGFASKQNHNLQYVMPLTTFPSWILVLTSSG